MNYMDLNVVSGRLLACIFMIGMLTACRKAGSAPQFNDTPPVEIVEGSIYYIDLEASTLYDLFMIESLQGNVNRVSPLIWVLKTPVVEYDGPGAMVDRSFWLNTIDDRQKIVFDDPFLMVRDFAHKFTDRVKGCVLYDSDIFGSYASGARHPQPPDNLVARLNATAMLCATYNAIALTKEQHNRLKTEYGLDLPVLANTTTDEFSNWLACYRYIYEHFSEELSTQEMANNSHYCLGMFDLLIKNKMFIINMKADPSVLEQNLTDAIFDRCPAPSPVYGVWNVAGGGPNEDSYQRYLNSRGKYAIVNFEAFNLSFTSGLPAYVPEKSETKRDLVYDPSKRYICFTQTDGDNYEFIQQVFPVKFALPGRADYPVGWEIPATLSELDPVAAKWYYQHMGLNSFVNPVTGAGYFKYMLPEPYLDEYFALTEQYMKEARYRTIRTMDYSFETGRLLTVIPSVEGVFCGYGGNDAARPTVAGYANTHEMYNGKPLFINYSYLDIDQVIAYEGPAPSFFSVACVYTNPVDVVNTIRSLPPDWMVVSPGEMVDIYKQYRKDN